MKWSKINKLKKKWKIENPKEWWQVPLWKLTYKRHGLLTPSLVQRMKLISDDAYKLGRKELFLQNLNKKRI